MLQAGRYCWAVPLQGTNTTIVSFVLSVTSFRVAFHLFIVKAGAASASSPYHQLHKHQHGCIDCPVESNPPNTSHISNSTHLIHGKPRHSLCCSTSRLRTPGTGSCRGGSLANGSLERNSAIVPSIPVNWTFCIPCSPEGLEVRCQ